MTEWMKDWEEPPCPTLREGNENYACSHAGEFLRRKTITVTKVQARRAVGPSAIPSSPFPPPERFDPGTLARGSRR